MSGDARAFQLAVSFLADVAGRPEPWPRLFVEWAQERCLTEEQQREVKVQILRQRVFGATARHYGAT
jgi:hypothetical protein